MTAAHTTISEPVVAALLAAFGVAAFAWALTGGHASLAWSSYLIGVFFALGLGVFGVAWISITTLARGVWPVSMRRLPEAMTAWLVPGGLLTLAVGLGAHTLYHWSHKEAVAADALLTHKAPFLNMGMFYALVAVSLVLWALFAAVMTGASRKQDQEGGTALTSRNHGLSALSWWSSR